jgi:predicted nucleic-acid-binding Zn-ribbon protein
LRADKKKYFSWAHDGLREWARFLPAEREPVAKKPNMSGKEFRAAKRRDKVIEYRRTCKRCGTEWYVSADQARREDVERRTRSGHRLQEVGQGLKMVGQPFSAKHDVRYAGYKARHEHEREQAESSQQCPSCGSMSFEQQPLTATDT